MFEYHFLFKKNLPNPCSDVRGIYMIHQYYQYHILLPTYHVTVSVRITQYRSQPLLLLTARYRFTNSVESITLRATGTSWANRWVSLFFRSRTIASNTAVPRCWCRASYTSCRRIMFSRTNKLIITMAQGAYHCMWKVAMRAAARDRTPDSTLNVQTPYISDHNDR